MYDQTDKVSEVALLSEFIELVVLYVQVSQTCPLCTGLTDMPFMYSLTDMPFMYSLTDMSFMYRSYRHALYVQVPIDVSFMYRTNTHISVLNGRV